MIGAGQGDNWWCLYFRPYAPYAEAPAAAEGKTLPDCQAENPKTAMPPVKQDLSKNSKLLEIIYQRKNRALVQKQLKKSTGSIIMFTDKEIDSKPDGAGRLDIVLGNCRQDYRRSRSFFVRDANDGLGDAESGR